eukprot:COSAG04_NODE_3688_length_2605_cov_3.627694_6_plen_54_part_01
MVCPKAACVLVLKAERLVLSGQGELANSPGSRSRPPQPTWQPFSNLNLRGVGSV